MTRLVTRPVEHLYSGTYPFENQGWKKISDITEKTAESLIGPLDHWLNKAFKIVNDDILGFTRGRRESVQAVYYHDNVWQLLECDSPATIVSCLDHMKTTLETKVAYLHRDIKAVCEKFNIKEPS